MRVGQFFELDGTRYQVAHVLPGRIVANVDTRGNKGAPKTVVFEAKDLPADFAESEAKAAGVKPGETVSVLQGAKRPAAEAIHGAKHGTYEAKFTGLVLDPYVDPATHDASIPVPDGSDLKADEWARFGKVDQLIYSNLMERFGPWKPDAAQKVVDGVKAKADADAKQLLHDAYSSQFGSSSGFTLSLHSIFKNLLDSIKGGQNVEAARTKFENARYWQAQAADVLRWDLYNRLRSPDVLLFHGTSEPELFSQHIIAEGRPVFAGLSQSQKFSPGAFGSSRFLTPLAIRHIVLATTSAEMYASSGGYKSEQEVATADAFRADKRSLIMPDNGVGSGMAPANHTAPGPSGLQKKWLTGISQHGVGGWALSVFRDSFKDGGANLPVPPEPPNIHMDSQGGKQWVAPPTDATQFAYVDGKKVGIPELGYAITDKKGRPVSMQVKQMVEQGMLHPGDYIEGMQGTRYLIVEDKSDPYLGLAYYKVTDLGTAVEGTQTNNAETQQKTSAFTNHNLYGNSGSEVYSFEGGGSKAFKLLKGHYDLPTLSETKGLSFTPQAWVEDAPKNAKFLKDYEKGDKFKVGGGYYEVTQTGLADGNVKIKNLESGDTGAINGSYKSPKLLLKAGYTEKGVPVFDEDDYLKGAPTTVGDALETVQPGDVMLVGKEPYTVTKKTQEGTVEAADQTGLLKTFSASQKFTPLIPKPPGWTEPQVGDTLAIEGEKATLTKVLKDGTYQFRKQKGGVVKMKPNDPRLFGIFHAQDYTIGTKSKLKDLPVGTLVHGGAGQKVRPYLLTKQAGKETVLKNLDTGEDVTVSSGKSYALLVKKEQVPAGGYAPTAEAPQDHVTPTVPSETFNMGAYEAGPEKAFSEMEPGDKFWAMGSAWEFKSKPFPNQYVLKNLSSGEIKTVPISSGNSVTTLVPKGETPAAAAGKVVGEKVLPSQLVAGDEFEIAGDTYEVVSASQVAGEPGQTLTLVNKTTNTELEPQEWLDSNFSEGHGTWTLTKSAKPPVQFADTSPEKFDPAAWDESAETVSTNPANGVLPTGTVLKTALGKAYVKIVDVKESPVPGGVKKNYVVQTLKKTPYKKPGDEFTLSHGTAYVLTPKETGVSAPAVPATKFDPTAYVENSAPNKTAAELDKGTIVKGAKGGYYQIGNVGMKDGKPSHVNATNLVTGKHTKFKPQQKFAGWLSPKAEGALAKYEDYKPGDPVPLMSLKPGDQFKQTNGTLFEVVGPGDEKNDAPGMKVGIVEPDGSVAAPFNAPAQTVKFFAHAKDKMPVQPAEAMQAVSVDHDKLPSLLDADYETFKWHKGGKTVTYTPLKQIAPGSVFLDKNDKPFKVVEAGAQPTVMDEGGKLYLAPSHVTLADGKTVVARGRVVKYGEGFDEKISKLGGITPQMATKPEETLAAAMEQGMVENKANQSIYQLGLGPGDVVKGALGKSYKIVSQDPNTGIYSLYDPVNDSYETTLGNYTPQAYKKPAGEGMFEEALSKQPSGAEVMSEPAEGLPTDVNDYELGPVKPGSELQAGDIYSGGAIPHVIFVAGKDADGMWLQDLTNGETSPSHVPQSFVDSIQATTLLTKSEAGLPETDLGGHPEYAGFSGDPKDYEAGDMALLKDLPVGSYFRSAKAKVFKLLSKNDDGVTAVVQDAEGVVFPAVAQTLGVKVLHPLPSAVTDTDHVPIGEKFVDLPVGTTFEAHGAVWTKTSDTEAKITSITDPTQKAPVGYESPIPNVEEVKVLSKPGLSVDEEPGEVSAEGGVVHPVFAPSVKIGDMKPGQKFIWGGSVYMVKEFGTNKVSGKPEAILIRENGLEMKTPIGDNISWWQMGSKPMKLYAEGMPKFSFGQFVKVTKPGNKTGKTARITALLPDGKYLVRFANGSGQQVDDSWLSNMKSPQWKTKQALGIPEDTPIGDLPEGTFVHKGFSSGYGYGSKVGEIVGPGESNSSWLKVEWSDGTTSEEKPQNKVGVLANPDLAAKSKRATANAIGATPAETPTTDFKASAVAPGLGGWKTNAPNGYSYDDGPGMSLDELPVGSLFTATGADEDPDAQLAWKKTGPTDAHGNVPWELVVKPSGKSGTLGATGTSEGNWKPVHVKLPEVTSGQEQTKASSATLAFLPKDLMAVYPLTIKDVDPKLGDYLVANGAAFKVMKFIPHQDGTVSYVLENMEDGKDVVVGPDFKPTSWAAGGSLSAATESSKAVPGKVSDAKIAAGMADVLGNEIDAQNLHVGDHFSAYGDPVVATKVWSTGKVDGISLDNGKPVSLGPYAKVMKLPPGTVQKPIEDLPTMSKFTVGTGKWGEGGHVWQVVPNSAVPSSMKPAMADLPDEGAMWAQDLSTGEYEWFGQTLPVTPLPEGAMPVSVEKAQVGDTVTGDNLVAGDLYKTSAGNTYKVLKVGPGAALKTKLVSAEKTDAHTQSLVGNDYETHPYAGSQLGVKTGHEGVTLDDLETKPTTDEPPEHGVALENEPIGTLVQNPNPADIGEDEVPAIWKIAKKSGDQVKLIIDTPFLKGGKPKQGVAKVGDDLWVDAKKSKWKVISRPGAETGGDSLADAQVGDVYGSTVSGAMWEVVKKNANGSIKAKVIQVGQNQDSAFLGKTETLHPAKVSGLVTKVGTKIDSLADANVGDLVTKGTGSDGNISAVWQKVGDGKLKMVKQMTGPDGTPYHGSAPIGTEYEPDPTTPETPWFKVGTAGLDAPQAGGEGPLNPFKWSKSGHTKYHQLRKLAPGDKFSDAKKQKFTVTKTEATGAPKGYVHYKDAAGVEYVAPAKAYVRLETP